MLKWMKSWSALAGAETKMMMIMMTVFLSNEWSSCCAFGLFLTRSVIFSHSSLLSPSPRSRMSRLTLSEGDFVARKGDKGGCLYVIESGLVERFVPGSDETHLHEPNLVLGMVRPTLNTSVPHSLVLCASTSLLLFALPLCSLLFPSAFCSSLLLFCSVGADSLVLSLYIHPDVGS